MRNRASVTDVATQIGSALLPDNESWINRFQIKSTSSASLYTIAQRRSDKVWGCSCPGWRHHRKCKHVKDVLQRLTAVAATTITSDERTAQVLHSARAAYLDLEPAAAVKLPSFKARAVDLD